MLQVKSSFNKQYLEFNAEAVPRNINPRRVWSFLCYYRNQSLCDLTFQVTGCQLTIRS